MTFVVTNVDPEIVFEMSFPTLSGRNVDFLDRKLRLRNYIIKKALPTTRHVELVGKKEFTVIALDPEHETFVIYLASLSSITSPSFSSLNFHPSCGPQIVGLIAKKTFTKFTKVSANHSDFADVFAADLTSKLPKHTEINEYAIKLVDGQQPLYEPIYSLELVGLETPKAYIEINLANRFFKLSKSPAGTPIIFNQKLDRFFQLCINYEGLNILTIKN